ncbi:MAG: hypothetical protein V1704_04300 [Candidatus Vogelbacteria bacterium]
MKKQTIYYLVIGIATIIIITGGWYAYKYRSCLKQINYIPPREQNEMGGGFSGLRRVDDKGDYYRFSFQQFRTSDEATRACIWK